ncbi:hypothetical protein Y1Q_0010198 [Alligator mississippiensis]|uniref:Uncharacterized protein n=1 Tax=Alligator mississippiensis TaxID=8496 RepID=A0A151NG91_ALLMI|nr:hypothetical protein Y1Q_0010198 [Alligator mississippiensis]
MKAFHADLLLLCFFLLSQGRLVRSGSAFRYYGPGNDPVCSWKEVLHKQAHQRRWASSLGSRCLHCSCPSLL